MAIDEKEFKEWQFETRSNTGSIVHIAERMDSYHQDNKLRFNKLEELLLKVPTEDKMFRTFVEESRKLSEGLSKRDDSLEERLTRHSAKISNLENKHTELSTNQKWQAIKLAGLGSVLSGLIVKYWDKIV